MYLYYGYFKLELLTYYIFPSHSQTEQFAVLWILFTVIVLGNSAVLFTKFRNKRKSRMNFFIKQLAIAGKLPLWYSPTFLKWTSFVSQWQHGRIETRQFPLNSLGKILPSGLVQYENSYLISDLSVGLLNVLTDIIWRITISWRAGNIACKVIRFSQVCVTYSSTYVLVALSIDRYDAITHPLNFSKSCKFLLYFITKYTNLLIYTIRTSWKERRINRWNSFSTSSIWFHIFII